MSGIEVFANGEFEIKITEYGDTFNVQAPGLARALGYRDATNMLRSIPEAEQGSSVASTPGGDQTVQFVEEPGFYRAIGQRSLGRIKDLTVRAQVERFQYWVYHEVLPALRRHGRYEMAIAPQRTDAFEPDAYTWRETCTVIRQAYEVRTHPAKLRRTLMAAGVLTQTFEPKADFAHCFWWTGTAYLVLRHCVPALFFHYQATERKLALASGQAPALSGPSLPVQAELFSQHAATTTS